MNAEQQLIDSALRTWKSNVDRFDTFFHALTGEQLQHEVAPGRNRLQYVWGHVAAVNDGLFPLLGIGPRLHPELESIFVTAPDRSVAALPSGSELKKVSGEIHQSLWSAFSRWSPSDWLAKHTAVSDDEFRKEPHRNRYTVLLSRTAHTAFHLGQVILTKPRS